jgi:hypothetical protein
LQQEFLVRLHAKPTGAKGNGWSVRVRKSSHCIVETAVLSSSFNLNGGNKLAVELSPFYQVHF